MSVRAAKRDVSIPLVAFNHLQQDGEILLQPRQRAWIHLGEGIGQDAAKRPGCALEQPPTGVGH